LLATMQKALPFVIKYYIGILPLFIGYGFLGIWIFY